MEGGEDVTMVAPPAANEPEPNNKKDMMISFSGQDPPAAESRKQPPNGEEEVEDAKSRTVKVANVDGQCTPVEVLMHFQYCGTIDKVTMKKGYAYVEFVEAAAVPRALLLDQSVLHGRRLNVTARKATAESHRNSHVPQRGPVMVLVPVDFYSPYDRGWVTAFVPQYFFPSPSEQFPRECEFRGVHDRQPEPAPEFSLSDDCIAEAEKDMIKEEIVNVGLSRRRTQEAEALKELQMEGFDFQGSEPFGPSVPSLAIDHHRQPPQQQTLGCSEEEHSQVPESNREELIIPENPDRGHCGVKRKVESLSEAPSLPCPSVKKPKEEWSCALCRVSSDCEKDLNSHFQGSRHKAQESTLIAELEALKAEVAAKGCNIPLVANNSPNLSKLSSTAAGSEFCAESKVTTLAVIPSDFCADAKIKVKEQLIPVHKTEVVLKAELPAKGCSTPLLVNKPANMSELSSTAASSELKAESKVTTPAVIPSNFCADAKIKVKEQVIPMHKAKEEAPKGELAAHGCSTPTVANSPSNTSKLSCTAAGSKLNAESKVTTMIRASDFGAGAKMKVKKKTILVCKDKEAALKAKHAAKGCSTPLLGNKPSGLPKLSSATAGSELNAEGEVTTQAVIASNFCADAKTKVKEQVILVHNTKEAAPKAELAADGCGTQLMANIRSNMSKLSSTSAGSKLNAESKVPIPIGASDFGAGAKMKVKKKTILVRKAKEAALKAKPAAKGCSTPLLANKHCNLSMLSHATAGSELNAEGEVTTRAFIPSDFIAGAKIKVKAHAIPVHRAKEAAPKADLAANGCRTPLMANIPSNMSKLSSTAAGSKLNAESKVSTPEIIAKDFTAYSKMKTGAQAKPVPAHCGVKRKVESLSEVSLHPCPGVKKPKEERSCALCHVRSNSEKAWNDHLQGRKHKANEAAVKAEVASKVCGSGTIPLANIPGNLPKLRSAAASSKLTADIKISTPAISASDFGAETKMKVEAQVISVDKAKDEALKAELAQGILVHKAKEAGLKGELAANGSSITLVANNTANLAKFGPTAAGSEVNAHYKVTTPANSASGSGANAKKKVETQVESKTEVLLPSQFSTSSKKKRQAMMRTERTTEFQWEKKFKYWCEMCKFGTCLPGMMDGHLKGKKHLKVVCQNSNHQKFAVPLLRLTADGKKGDVIAIGKAKGSMVQDIKTEGVQYVPENGLENAEHSIVVQEADAKIFQILSEYIGRKVNIEIVKADGSIALDAKAEGVHDVRGKEKIESAASNAIAAEIVTKAEHSKVVREADAKTIRLVSGSMGETDSVAILEADGSMVQDPKIERLQDVGGKSAASNATTVEVVAKTEHPKIVREVDAKAVRLVSGVAIVKADGSVVQDPKTEEVHDVPGKEKVGSAASNGTNAEVVAKAEHPKVVREADGKIVRLVSEAHAELLQPLSGSIGKQDHIATGKADGSMVQDLKTEAVEDVPENERTESAAANPIAV